jgi:hypothetical protein
MVKVIVAKEKLDMTHMLGQFPDESHYDFLIEEDCDVYMPANCDLALKQIVTKNVLLAILEDERRIVLKFRKNYFLKNNKTKRILVCVKQQLKRRTEVWLQVQEQRS